MHTDWQQLDALLKNSVALKILDWSRGRLVTLQILTSSSFILVEETHGSSGQCVSFFLIYVGSSFTAHVLFLFFSFLCPTFLSNRDTLLQLGTWFEKKQKKNCAGNWAPLASIKENKGGSSRDQETKLVWSTVCQPPNAPKYQNTVRYPDMALCQA